MQGSDAKTTLKKKQQWQNEDQKTHTLGRSGEREPGLCGFRK